VYMSTKGLLVLVETMSWPIGPPRNGNARGSGYDKDHLGPERQT
jgi:hypothetical protein